MKKIAIFLLLCASVYAAEKGWTDQKILQTTKETVLNIQQLARRSRIREANIIAKELSAYSAGRPTASGCRQISTQTEKLLFLALCYEDVKQFPDWRKEYEKHYAARYLPRKNTIIWRPGLYSPFWQSIILLHEGYHNRHHQAVNADDPTQRLQMEVEAHTFQNSLVLAVADHRYKSSIESEVLRAVKQSRADGKLFFPPNTANWMYEDIFGKCLSQKEASARIFHTKICIVFSIIERLLESDQQLTAKMMALDQMYKYGELR